MKFSEYREARDSIEFDRKFSLLCENIARSEKGFDSWWSSEGLPTILESHKYENEDELLVELLGGVGNAMGNMAGRAWQGAKNLGSGLAHGWGAGQQAAGQWAPQGQQPGQPPVQTPMQDPNAPVDAELVDPNAPAPDPGTAGADPNAAAQPAAGGPEAAAQQQAPAMSPEKQQRLDAFQRGIDQSTDTIKQKFSTAMKDFLNSVQQDAVKDGPSGQTMWQIAKNFNKQVMAAAQPAIDSFKQTGSYGTPKAGGYQDQFAAAQGAYSNNQQANLKQQLQAKHGGQQQTAGAQQSLAPQTPDMKTPITQLAKQQVPGAHMRPGMAVR